MKTSPSPSRMARLAFATALMPLAHSRFTVSPGTDDRQPREQQRHAGDVAIVLACLVGAPEHHVGDALPIQTRVTIEQLGDDVRAQIVGPHVGQAPAKAADRRAHSVDEEYGLHGHSHSEVIRAEL